MCPCFEFLYRDRDTNKWIRRVFSIQQDRVAADQTESSVTVRVHRYMYKVSPDGILKPDFKAGPLVVAKDKRWGTEFEQRCSTYEQLLACLFQEVGLGFRDVLLYVHGVCGDDLKSPTKRAVDLRRKTPCDWTSVGVFSYNSCGKKGGE